jgi:hypothetical protein
VSIRAEMHSMIVQAGAIMRLDGRVVSIGARVGVTTPVSHDVRAAAGGRD